MNVKSKIAKDKILCKCSLDIAEIVFAIFSTIQSHAFPKQNQNITFDVFIAISLQPQCLTNG